MNDDDFWGATSPGDVSIDTADSKEMMVGSHITEQHTYEYQGPDPPELLNVVPKESQTHDSPENYQLDLSNKSKDSNILSNILSKTNNVTNNVTNTPDTDVLNQENQDYCNRRDQQYFSCKYDNGLEQVTLELTPDIILE